VGTHKKLKGGEHSREVIYSKFGGLDNPLLTILRFCVRERKTTPEGEKRDRKGVVERSSSKKVRDQ